MCLRLHIRYSANLIPKWLLLTKLDKYVKVRARSATDLLLRLLVGAPVVTVNSAASLIGRSFVHPNEAVTRLVETGILKQVSVGRRNRAIETPEIIVAFAALERQLAHFE
ncbi:hypothetical protein AXFE_05950 [Acidithrix ferrooxidans]|uniref:Uncharacterized protein n=1 Tax=Acidithrix ferrooxidans TaxID=1280514 RepID=A0A0D8HKL7_9ACTN|nr:hypothetical protein AXFE_05950 [Acidithrix ferrooxidans]